MSTPVLLAWSGGKDSTLALERLRADPSYRVVGLLTTVTAVYERIAIHGVRRSILQRQSEALGLPLIEATIPPQASNDVYEAAFADALARAQVTEPKLDAIAFGDLYLADVRAYREALLQRLGWRGVYPIWGEDTAEVARRFIARGYRAILSCVDTQQIDADFCGCDFDATLLADLPASCDPCGENGEFHTCVYAGPMFAQPIALARGERVLRDGRFEYVDLIEV
ncbi:MAG: ATP-binding protein [Rudaea sp.]|uniref:Dph6-related ATP pyrophosphatase n=1 Tax=unclassified Rudaea TaxID=2627037 RepID=UPI0010FA3FC2|nr:MULTISPECIES: ATP-binding protein [unclassified Rudaea]MBN8886931.1 ATP-binding protein [Rudaea sp.]MBR0346931.1 ATP-binding protein [Rudaea sp.]